jgi:hypothetical protein
MVRQRELVLVDDQSDPLAEDEAIVLVYVDQ